MKKTFKWNGGWKIKNKNSTVEVEDWKKATDKREMKNQSDGMVKRETWIVKRQWDENKDGMRKGITAKHSGKREKKTTLTEMKNEMEVV